MALARSRGPSTVSVPSSRLSRQESNGASSITRGRLSVVPESGPSRRVTVTTSGGETPLFLGVGQSLGLSVDSVWGSVSCFGETGRQYSRFSVRRP